ncbi:MAG: hypothetical protein OEW15_07675 [Nitrospirota bacterium]|nr:hypothetical protein [Nitrospirota bacterium]
MPSLLERLFGKRSRIQLDHDRIWKTQTLKLNGIMAHAAWLDRHATRVLMVTHFIDTFRTLEALFHSRALPYTPMMTGSSAVQLRDLQNYRPGHVLLALSDALPDIPKDQAKRVAECGFDICILVAEHHPVPAGEKVIDEFGEKLPCTVRLCYHEALDAALLKQFSGDLIGNALSLLKVPDTEAITHASIDRAIRQAQKKISRRTKTNHAADSADQWFRNNMPRD